MGMASLIRTIRNRLSVSLLLLLQAQLNFLHLENNAKDDDTTAPDQCHQLPSKSIFLIRSDSSS